jgi:hypothetical protein
MGLLISGADLYLTLFQYPVFDLPLSTASWKHRPQRKKDFSLCGVGPLFDFRRAHVGFCSFVIGLCAAHHIKRAESQG